MDASHVLALACRLHIMIVTILDCKLSLAKPRKIASNVWIKIPGTLYLGHRCLPLFASRSL
jgi:hypothetical protein